MINDRGTLSRLAVESSRHAFLFFFFFDSPPHSILVHIVTARIRDVRLLQFWNYVFGVEMRSRRLPSEKPNFIYTATGNCLPMERVPYYSGTRIMTTTTQMLPYNRMCLLIDSGNVPVRRCRRKTSFSPCTVQQSPDEQYPCHLVASRWKISVRFASRYQYISF